MAKAARNVSDPNGYYEELGIYPWASDSEIKRALRIKLKTYHPDGDSPDEDKFLRFKEIGEVLTNLEMKSRYEATKSGELFVDSEIRKVLAMEGIPLEEVATPFDVIEEEEEGEIFFDYFSLNHDPFDMMLAQSWYDSLVSVAPIFGYTKTIRVLLHDGEPDWLNRAGILMVPRTWKPSKINAFALFSVKVC